MVIQTRCTNLETEISAISSNSQRKEQALHDSLSQLRQQYVQEQSLSASSREQRAQLQELTNQLSLQLESMDQDFKNTISDMQNQIEAGDVEIRRLTSIKSELEKRNEGMKEHVADLKNERDNMAKQIEQLSTLTREQANNLRSSEQQISELQQRVHEERNEVNNLRSEVSHLNSQVQRLSSEREVSSSFGSSFFHLTVFCFTFLCSLEAILPLFFLFFC